MQNINYVKLLLKDFDYDPRDTRELQVAVELGFDVLLICNRVIHINEYLKANIKICENSLPNNIQFKSKFRRWLIIIKYWFSAAQLVGKKTPDCISAHDYQALVVAFIAKKIYRLNKTKLIYDSHEFELGRKIRSKWKYKFIKTIESFLIKRSDATIVPCDPIANELFKLYHLRKRPIVIRSTPDFWKIDELERIRIRNEYLNYFELENPFILICHGLIFQAYGLSNVINEIKDIRDCVLIILGNENGNGYLDELKSLVIKNGMEKRVLFKKAVPYPQLKNYVSAADLGIVLFNDSLLNAFFVLPNKFFEMLQGEIPVLVSDFPAMSPIVEKYDIGYTVNPNDREMIIKNIRNLQNNKELYCKYKENVLYAKQKLCWEHEKKILRIFFETLFLEGSI